MSMMLKIALLSFLFAAAYGEFYEESAAKYAGQKDHWTAGYNSFFRGMSEEKIRSIMGTKLDRRSGTPRKAIYGNFDSRPAFNSADKWPRCRSTINFIKDQADCGSCWAVAASAVVADRTCIANEGFLPPKDRLNEQEPAVDMSAEEMMSCCDWCGDGCQGGYPIDAMRFWCWDGLVTGGWYGSNCGCQPYSLPPCGTQGCKGPIDQTPRCSHHCRHGYPRKFKDDKHKCREHYEIKNGEQGIMNEIATRGPVECAFTVYENFMHYKNGIYTRAHGKDMGGHAIKIVGWGTDPHGEKYWIINNSWNTTWGMNGVFWFKRGDNLCGMEEQCVAGVAKGGDRNFQLQC